MTSGFHTNHAISDPSLSSGTLPCMESKILGEISAEGLLMTLNLYWRAFALPLRFQAGRLEGSAMFENGFIIMIGTCMVCDYLQNTKLAVLLSNKHLIKFSRGSPMLGLDVLDEASNFNESFLTKI